MIKETIKEAETRMKGAIESLEEDLAGIRTGRASPALIEKLQVEYYGTATPLNAACHHSVPEARVLLIRPFDPSTLKAIEKAILASDLGLTPTTMESHSPQPASPHRGAPPRPGEGGAQPSGGKPRRHPQHTPRCDERPERI